MAIALLWLVWSILLALALFVIYGSKRFILDWQFRKPPGPRPLPFIGSSYHISDPRKKPWKVFDQLSKIYGPVYTFYLGQTRVIMLTTAPVIRKALVTNAKYYSYRSDNFVPGWNAYLHGIVSSYGEIWSQLRRFCLHALRDFGAGQMQLVARVNEEAVNLQHELENPVDEAGWLNALVMNAVSNIVGASVYGQGFSRKDEQFSKIYRKAAVFFERPLEQGAIYLGIPFLARLALPPHVRDIIDLDNLFRESLTKAVKEHKQDFDATHIRDFVDLYIEAERNSTERKPVFPFDRFVATMRDMLLAGTETTASAIIWTVIYLCKWPDVQKRCQQEIDEVINTDRLPSLEDRPNLVYVDAVLCEILRHVTIVPNALYHATMDELNELEGYEIPPRSLVIYNVWSVHHDEAYWKDPEVFRPERWINRDDFSLLSHSTHFMPFGVGPRICLGEQLARLEFFIYVVAMLQRFNFSFPDNYDVDLDSGRHYLTQVPPSIRVAVSSRRRCNDN